MFFQTPAADDRRFRTFSLSTSFIEKFKDQQPKWGWGGLGYFTYKRTYARDLPDGTTEEWYQTVQRVVEGCFNIQKLHCRQMGLPWNEAKAQRRLCPRSPALPLPSSLRKQREWRSHSRRILTAL